jgi:hypothetical protein
MQKMIADTDRYQPIATSGASLRSWRDSRARTERGKDAGATV